MDKDRLALLLKAYTEHRISEQELEELTAYLISEEEHTNLQQLMQESWEGMKPGDELEIPGDAMYQAITSNPQFISQGKQQVLPKKRPLSRPLQHWPVAFYYAASVFVVLSVAFYLFYAVKGPTKQSAELAAVQQPLMIRPGSSKAMLTLADGRKILLENHRKGKVASQSGMVLVQNGGQLSYENSGRTVTADPSAQNTVSTPRGGEYQVHLEDGTIVWLNSSSSLSYPVTFNTAQRRVKISGEAYFEVAKNPRVPFVVEANGTEVRVLGTHFNVNAYSDDLAVKTTLVEGAVRVTKNGEQALLKPDQQAISTAGPGRIRVLQVDAMEALAWKNGTFLFENESIENVMKVIARWYAIDVSYRGDVSHKTFGGTISRFETFEKLLRTLELTGAIHFKIEGRRVIVMP